MKTVKIFLSAFAFILAIGAAFAVRPLTTVGYSNLEGTCKSYATQEGCSETLTNGTVCTIFVPGFGTQNAKRTSSCPNLTMFRPS